MTAAGEKKKNTKLAIVRCPCANINGYQPLIIPEPCITRGNNPRYTQKFQNAEKFRCFSSFMDSSPQGCLIVILRRSARDIASERSCSLTFWRRDKILARKRPVEHQASRGQLPTLSAVISLGYDNILRPVCCLALDVVSVAIALLEALPGHFGLVRGERGIVRAVEDIVMGVWCG